MTLATVPRYDDDIATVVGDHAVVLGASMAGLVTARVLADAFETVTVVDRDSPPDEPVPRRGVPQSTQAHLLIDAGRIIVDDLFPTLSEDLLTAGALLIDASRNFSYFSNDAFLEFEPLPAPLYMVSRPLLEQVVRDSVAAIDGVDLRWNCQFLTFDFDEDDRRVTGVTLRSDGDEETLPADLVVDATGRASRTPRWLAEHGYEQPPVDEVTIDLAYTTATIERPPDDRRAYFVPPDPPRTRGCFVFPVEDDRWLLTMNGMHGDHAPADAAGFIEYTEGLPIPDVHDLLETYPMVEEPVKYPYMASRRNRYWELPDFPDGLLPVGDAIASFNPIFGQGMTVAAFEAVILHRELCDGGLDGLWDRYVGNVEAVVETAWLLSVGRDFQYPQTTGPKPRGVDVFSRYIDYLTVKARTDGWLSRALREVVMMDKPPTSLLRPGIVWRALRPW